MTLTLRTDPSHPGGGFALLEGASLAGVSSITVENGFSGQFLGDDGKWGRHAFALPVEDAPGGLSLGPHIVDHVPTELQVELRTGEGRRLGRIFWTDVIPSRTLASVTSAQVLEDRRRAEERNAARIALAALESIAAEEAETRRAEERARLEQAALESVEQAMDEEEAPRIAAAEAADRAPLAPGAATEAVALAVPELALGCQTVGRHEPPFARSPAIAVDADAIFTRFYDERPSRIYAVIAIVVAVAASASGLALKPDLLSEISQFVPNAWSPMPTRAIAQRRESLVGQGCQLVSNADEWRSGDWSAQIAVADDVDDARTACLKLHRRFSKFYFDAPHILALDDKGSRTFSVRLSGNLDRARSLCRFITGDGGECSVVRSGVPS